MSAPPAAATARHALLAAAVAVAVAGAGAPAAPAQGALTAAIHRISVTSAGAEAAGLSYGTAISAEGRYIAFASSARNLAPGDSNESYDVFVRDIRTARTTRVSVPAGGGQANGDSTEPAVSADSRYITFTSVASNLVPGDTNGAADVFVRDRHTGSTTRVSVPSRGGQAAAESGQPAMSADGRYVAFTSEAANLVPGDTNDAADIFVRDRRGGLTSRISVPLAGAVAGPGGSYAPALSADGRYVAFSSSASDLVPHDTNEVADVFVRDRRSGMTSLISRSTGGVPGDDTSVEPAISADGRYVAFRSNATNLVAGDTNDRLDIFVRDRRTGGTTRVSVSSTGAQGNDSSFAASISEDGRFVAFTANASNLVPDDTNDVIDLFIRDRSRGTTGRVGGYGGGVQPDGHTYDHEISANGRHVGFSSWASNLVPGDTNGNLDVFRAPAR